MILASEHAQQILQRNNCQPYSQPENAMSQFQSAGEIRLLILDDDPQTCQLIKSILNSEGFQIDVLSDPAMAEEWLKNQNYHLIVMDVVIPGLELEQMFEWIHLHQPDSSVIVVTAYPSIESATSSLRGRAYDYLTKPFQIEQLRKIVMRCLETKGMIRMTEDALKEALGAVIRNRRKFLKLTLQQLSQRTGVSLGYLSQIELGKNSASIETLYRISMALGVKLADLFNSIQKNI